MCDVKVAFIEFLCQVLPILTIKFFKHPTKPMHRFATPGIYSSIEAEFLPECQKLCANCITQVLSGH